MNIPSKILDAADEVDNWMAMNGAGDAWKLKGIAARAGYDRLERENVRLREELLQNRATFLALMPDFGGPIAAQMKKAVARLNDILSNDQAHLRQPDHDSRRETK